MNRDAKCHNPKMAVYCEAVHLRHEYNAAVDELAKLAAPWEPTPWGVFVNDQHRPSVDFGEEAGPSVRSGTDPGSGGGLPPGTARMVATIVSDPGRGPDPYVALDPDIGPDPPPEREDSHDPPDAEEQWDWRVPLLVWLADGKLPPNQTEARRLARCAKSFRIVDQELYRRGHNGVLQRCILAGEGRSLLEDIHGGVCGHHAAPRAIVGSIFRQGFYWPTVVDDAEQIVRTCEGCQFYAWQTHLPAQALQTIPISWPFAVWGLDMVGPLP